MSRAAPSSSPSAALPVLLWGILGGMLGGLACCCWVTPAATSFLAARQARNERGPESGSTFGVGAQAAAVSALLVASFGTALYVWVNDPARMSESRRAMVEMLGGGGAADMPLGLLAMGFAAVGFAVSFGLGLLGAALGGGGRRSRGPAGPPGGSATRFLHQAPAATPGGPAARAPAPVAAAPSASAARFLQDAPAPAAPPSPPPRPAVAPAPQPTPAAAAEPDAATHGDPGTDSSAAWDRFRRPDDPDRSAADLETRAGDLADQGEEVGAWDDEDGAP